MNKKISILLLFFTFISTTLSVVADNSSTYTVTVTQEPIENDDDYVDDRPGKHRMPPKPIICTISLQQIIIPGIDNDEILSFELFGPDGSCAGSFLSEQDFILFLFQCSGTYEIRFYTDQFVLHGYIEL